MFIFSPRKAHGAVADVVHGDAEASESESPTSDEALSGIMFPPKSLNVEEVLLTQCCAVVFLFVGPVQISKIR